MLTELRSTCARIAIVLACLLSITATSQKLGADDTPPSASRSSLEAQIAGLIEQLGHENFRVRVNAQQMLDRIGLPAYEQLRGALDHSNIQIARSAEYLLRSQNVTWWLESDSHEVRTRLQDYSSLDLNNRQTRLLELANLASDDAMLALTRIAKFENSELCSRAAALELLKKLTSIESPRREKLAQSILLTLGTANRPATQWLETYSKQAIGTVAFDLTVWTDYADRLGADLKNTSNSNYLIKGSRDQPFMQQKLQVLQFYEWLVGWIRRDHDRDQALAVAKKSTQLATQNLHAVHEYCTWALSVDLPELVIDLFNNALSDNSETVANPQPALQLQKARQASLFDRENSQLLYLMAEAHRKLGNEEEANGFADQARQVPIAKLALMNQLARNSVPEIQAIQRVNISRALKERGQFDWAIAELDEAIKLETKSENGIRLELAELYRDSKQYAKAVETMDKIVSEPPPADRNLPLADDFSYMLASYHWYQALDASEKGDRDKAIAELMIACEKNDESQDANPDIIIALYRLAKSPEEKAAFRGHFNKLVDKYRSDVAESENTITQAVGALSSTQRLAEYCNQLAWLLASCETNVEEAIYLSQRSLEFDPKMHTYLDTMARCCLAAGRLDEALDYQKQAVAGSPNSLSMKGQLAEIERAIEKSKKKSTDNGQ